MPQAPFAFEFGSERWNGNSVKKQSANYHLSDLEKSIEQLKGNSATVMSLNCHLRNFIQIWRMVIRQLFCCHSVIQTQTQTQTEPAVFRKHEMIL